MISGCLSLVLVAMTSSRGNLGLVGGLMSVSIIAMGLAELLPTRLRPVAVALRILSLILAVATLVIAVYSLISGQP